MARRSRPSKGKSKPEETWDDPERDEVDLFHENQEKILLDQAGGRVQKKDDMELSDEEVMALDQASDDDDSEAVSDEEDYYGVGKEGDEEDEDEEAWGTSRANYYGADEAEDEEEAKEEEKEALKLQKKHLSEMAAEDYFEDDDLEDWKQSAREVEAAESNIVYDQLPDQDPSQLDESERLKLLDTTYPEVLPLSKELTQLQGRLEELQPKAKDSKVASIQFTALTAYLGTIKAYFALFVSSINDGLKADLKEHSVMEGILKAREVWRVAQQLDGVDGDALSAEESEEFVDAQDSFVQSDEEPLSEPESVDDAEMESPEGLEETRKRKADSDDSDEDEFTVSLPVAKPKKKKRVVDIAKDYGEEDINDIDLEEKLAKKRSIRFYTSKIDQVSNKNKIKYNGDDDIEYKERHFERQRRLAEEARLRGLQSAEKDEADVFSSDDEEGPASSANGSANDYYEKIKSASHKKKEDRKKSHEMAVKAAKEGKLAEFNADDDLDESGKRALNFQILKNKGITPKRKKENRNARVKKRVRYETAKKKLASSRRLYKQPTTAYGGEETGIKKNITRSVKFAS
ncbi:something about silencing protein 10 [Trichomonascus vanleenenianus]|uniref:rRNA-processing protein SAS10 n=1 Tax=Trichomonascus vanleenenianus TaxID=2268995 RepID=UPI003ECA4916